MIQYRKIIKKDKENVKALINDVLDNLERKEFFIPFTSEEIEDIFDETKTIAYGAFDNNKLIGTAQLFLEPNSELAKIKDTINLENDRVAELGGYLVLSDYRRKGIMKQLESILISEARKINYEYIVVTVHPDNIASNKATEYTGAKIVKTTNLGKYLRNIYLLKL